MKDDATTPGDSAVGVAGFPGNGLHCPGLVSGDRGVFRRSSGGSSSAGGVVEGPANRSVDGGHGLLADEGPDSRGELGSSQDGCDGVGRCCNQAIGDGSLRCDGNLRWCSRWLRPRLRRRSSPIAMPNRFRPW